LYLLASVVVHTREWALIILDTNSTGQTLAFIFAGVHCLLRLLYRFWYLSHIIITFVRGNISRTGC
jgi:hypothetical protein